MRRPLVPLLNVMLMMLFVCAPLAAQEKAPMQTTKAAVAKGIRITFFISECSFEVEGGEDVFGVRVFKLSKKMDGKTLELDPPKATKQKIMELLGKAQELSYKLKPDNALWAFDGDSLRVEIRSGVRHLTYENIIENMPNSEIFLEILATIRRE